MLNPQAEEYLQASYHGTQVGQLIAELGKKFLPSDYPLAALNDRETVRGMAAVLDAIKEKLDQHLANHPFKS